MPYSSAAQPAAVGDRGAAPGYGLGAYSGPQPTVLPVTMSVGDAVQWAHAEGFGFGEAVARDAPALWLEAVLARKPRMPSDLEARLLQGSALPIDSLLHDEVRTRCAADSGTPSSARVTSDTAAVPLDAPHINRLTPGVWTRDVVAEPEGACSATVGNGQLAGLCHEAITARVSRTRSCCFPVTVVTWQ